MQPPVLSETAWVYDPLQPDAYLLHLAGIAPACAVTAAEDIYTDSHILILKQGASLSAAIAQSMLSQRLCKPIEDSVVLSYTIDQDRLLQDLALIMEQDDVLFALNERMGLLALLGELCPVFMQHELLRQKLTVMCYALPDLYKRSLYSTWLSLCIAKEMRLSLHDITLLLVAALSHDMGMLHIDSQLWQKPTAISAEEWMRIQRHVAIGSGLLKRVKNMPWQVVLAVYEHHEQSDGSGYPLAKLENELSLLGQIINVADAIIAIHFNYEWEHRRSWREIIPLIHMNAQAYLTRANEILSAVVRRAELPQKNVVQGDAAPAFIAELLDKNRHLQSWFTHMRESLQAIGLTHGDKRLHALQTIMAHLVTSAEGSGIFNADQWPQLMASCAAEIRPRTALAAQDLAALDVPQEYEKLHLLQQEFIFHLQRLSRMTQLYLESGECKDNTIRFALSQGLQSAQRGLQ